jgi:glycosyltransferase involved in cell wall biosynthesis
MGTDFSDVTFVIVCYNEAFRIRGFIRGLKDFGAKHILVIDDSSSDNTYRLAKKEKVEVLKNSGSQGFTNTILKGLYNIHTSNAMLIDPTFDLDKRELFDFIEYGIKGNFSVLFPTFTKEAKRIKLSLIKRGVLIEGQLFDFVFLNQDLIKKLKKETIREGLFLYLEIIRVADKNKLKIGTFAMPKSHENRPYPRSALSSLPEKIKLNQYLKEAFPLRRDHKIRDKIIIAVLGYLIIRVIELLINYLIKLTS